MHSWLVLSQDDEESAVSEGEASGSPPGSGSGRLVIDEGNAEASETPLCQGCRRRDAQFVCAGCANQWYCSRDCQVRLLTDGLRATACSRFQQKLTNIFVNIFFFYYFYVKLYFCRLTKLWRRHIETPRVFFCKCGFYPKVPHAKHVWFFYQVLSK